MADNNLASLLRDFAQGASNSAATNLSMPVDVIAWLLRKGGVPVPNNPVGGSDWMAEKGFTPEPKNKLAGLLGDAAGFAAPLAAVAKAPQIAKGLLQAGELLPQGSKALPSAGGNQLGAIVWHGSPHKFDAFDASKIGTGEGAQAYGHGLYLAENPKVATEYSKMGTGAGGQIPSPLRFVNGQEVQPGTGAYKAADLLDSMSIPQARKTVNEWLKTARPEEAAYFQDVANTLSTITSKSAVKQKMPGGSLYKVDLPDNAIAKMLDWDKPLSQQAPDVQKMLEPLGYSTKAQVDKYGDDLLAALHGNSTVELGTIRNPMGSDIARGGGIFDSKAQIEKANKLRELGITGIKYLDGGSRGAGNGTSNYVVFPGNERLLKILERNGESVAPKPASVDLGYRGQHTAPMKGDGSAPLHELTKIYPDDIYSNKAAQYYGHYGDSRDFDAVRLMQQAKDKICQ